MIIWVAWPTNNIERSNATAKVWAQMRYQVAVATEQPVADVDITAHRVFRFNQYDGYYRTMNTMCQWLTRGMKADVVICAGDGILPATNFPAWAIGGMFINRFPNGFGVMQPAGHQWTPWDHPRQYNFHDLPDTTRRCESPWIGRPFILQMYGGLGPYDAKYRQYWGDVELCDVARNAGILWTNPAIAQKSTHWSQAGAPDGTDKQKDNYTRSYETDSAHYRSRRFRRFPGHERNESRIAPVVGGRIITP